jgi:UDP-glucuronate 4-epimerase
VSELAALDGRHFDAIIHLAARAGVRASVERPELFYQTNLMGTLNLLESCRRLGVKKFVLASTSSIYGANPPTPRNCSSSRPLSRTATSCRY